MQTKLWQPDREILKDATFSECGKYRYVLERSWALGTKPMLIGLNPSTANADKDDPTIRRIIGLMQAMGFPGFYMMNLFAFVSANPADLKTCDDPQGQNNYWLACIEEHAYPVIFCWGNFKVAPRDQQIISKYPNAKCFGKNANGSPKHPLYLPANTGLIDF